MPRIQSSGRGPKRQVQLLVLAVIAIAGLAASGIWLWTSQKSWKAVMFERSVNRDQDVSTQTLVQVWEQSRNLGKTFLPGPHVHLPGLISQIMIADLEIPEEERALALIYGQESIQNALARDPAHSHSWARLAWYSYLLEGPSEEVVANLRMSIYTAPAKRSLIFWRIRMAGLCRDFWDQDFENLLIRQLNLAWRISPRELFSVVSGTDMEEMVNEIVSSSN
jgi:hypothetical protein